MTKESKILTTDEVAELYGVETKDVLYAARKGKLNGRKKGWIWLFHKDKLPETWPVRAKKRRKLSEARHPA